MSVTVRLDKRVKAAIATIDDDAWQTIQYTDAVFDQTTNTWISRAEVAEIDFTAFTSKKKADQIPGRLVVRRIPDLNPKANHGQATLFDTWRFHAFFTTSDPDTIDTVTADKTHRGHAIIEQVNADLKNSALAHLPSGTLLRQRRLAGARLIAFNLTRAAATLTGANPGQGDHRHDPPQTDHRPGPDRLLRATAHPAPANRLAMGNRLDRTVHPRLRTTRRNNHLTTQPNRRDQTNQWNTPAARRSDHTTPTSHNPNVTEPEPTLTTEPIGGSRLSHARDMSSRHWQGPCSAAPTAKSSG